jgi:hypothetical protein
MNTLMNFRRYCAFIFCLLVSSLAIADESWMGIYIQKVKLGYSGSVSREDTYKGKPAQKVWSISVFKGQMIGGDLEVTMTSTSWTDASGNPLRMEFRTTSGGRTQKVDAEFSGNQITAEIDNNGSKSRKVLTIPAGAKVLDDTGATAMTTLGKPKDQATEVYILDPTTVSLVKNSVIYRGKSPVKVGENQFTADLVEILDPRATTQVFYSSKGDVIQMIGPMGMTMLPQPKEVAMSMAESEGQQVDLAYATSIPVTGKFERPSDSTELTIKVFGRNFNKLPSDSHQTVKKDGDHLLITIHPRQSEPATLPTSPDFSKPSMHLPSDDAEIIALAKKTTNGATTPAEKVERVRAYVHELMGTNTGIGVLRDAREVLQTKEGLCRDHAILTATLIRAAGIPAKLASGLVYDQGAFFYHAWVEYFDKRWIAVDSTRSRPRLSAGYLKLADGNVEEAFLFPVLDGAKIEVVNVVYEKGLGG